MQPEILEQAVDLNGKPRGLFNDDGRISDPRGLGVNRDEGLLFLKSGADRVLALNRDGQVIRDTGPMPIIQVPWLNGQAPSFPSHGWIKKNGDRVPIGSNSLCRNAVLSCSGSEQGSELKKEDCK